MSEKTFFLVSGLVFMLVALLHVLRLALRWEAVLGGFHAPYGLSVIGVLIPGYLAYTAFDLFRRSR